MDPWQQTVETRLGELRADLRGVATDVGAVKVDLAGVNTKLEELPGKGFVAATVLGGMALFAAVITFATEIKALFHLH